MSQIQRREFLGQSAKADLGTRLLTSIMGSDVEIPPLIPATQEPFHVQSDLVLACLGLPAAAPAEPAIVCRVVFGAKQPRVAGLPCDPAGLQRHAVLLEGHGLSTRDRGGGDWLRRSFISGIRAELWVGLDNGRYQVELLWGDQAYAATGRSTCSCKGNPWPTPSLPGERVPHPEVHGRGGSRSAADPDRGAGQPKPTSPLAGMTIRGPQQRP